MKIYQDQNRVDYNNLKEAQEEFDILVWAGFDRHLILDNVLNVYAIIDEEVLLALESDTQVSITIIDSTAGLARS
tara:strand:+ start:13327 stop:13551 length:225 start_codon:yes stop_codon:yes gene_type:complete